MGGEQREGFSWCAVVQTAVLCAYRNRDLIGGTRNPEDCLPSVRADNVSPVSKLNLRSRDEVCLQNTFTYWVGGQGDSKVEE